MGIHVDYNAELLRNLNLKNRILKIQRKLNLWKQRNLTCFGKILIIKTFVLSELLFISSVLLIPDNIINEIEKMIFEFLWNGKTHKVKKQVVIQDYEFGGCRMIDLRQMIKVQNLKWVKRILTDRTFPGKVTMQKAYGYRYFDIIFRSNPRLEHFKLVPNFYYKILSDWKSYRNGNFTETFNIQDQYIWLNQSLLVDDKMLYSNYFIERGILQIGDILDPSGKIMSFDGLCTKYDIEQTKHMYYLSICYCIPKKWKYKIRQEKDNILQRDTCILVGSKHINFSEVNLRLLYRASVKNEEIKSAAYWKYTARFGITDDEWKKIYMLPHKLRINSKSRELQYAILQKFVATNKLLFLMKKIDSPACNFCQMYSQSTTHLFYECFNVKNLWLYATKVIKDDFNVDCIIDSRMALFGKYCNQGDIIGDNTNCNINIILAYTKSYIFMCKINQKEILNNGLKTYLKKHAKLFM